MTDDKEPTLEEAFEQALGCPHDQVEALLTDPPKYRCVKCAQIVEPKECQNVREREQVSLTCETCRFWKAGPDPRVGPCRRYPPTIVPLIEGRDGDCYTETIYEWPMTESGNFCGEWSPK